MDTSEQARQAYDVTKPKRPLTKLKRFRARERWRRVQSHVRSASLAFSVAGLERRRGFVERRWSTIPYADTALKPGADLASVSPEDALLEYRNRSRLHGQKSVSFEDDHFHRTSRYHRNRKS